MNTKSIKTEERRIRTINTIVKKMTKDTNNPEEKMIDTIDSKNGLRKGDRKRMKEETRMTDAM